MTDLLAALALVLVIEGLALAIFSNTLPGLLSALRDIGEQGVRRAGLIGAGLGAVGYLLIRSGA